MFRPLAMILVAFLLLAPPLAKAGGSDHCPPGFVSNTPECVAKSAFEGSDSDMPTGILYQMAISPIRNGSGNLVVPTTIPEAFRLLEDMLPHWYLNALRRSRGDDECDVVVNGMSYGAITMSWVRANWNLGDKTSLLRRRFLQLGYRYEDQIDQALAFGFCAYLKSDDDVQKGMEVIEERASPVRLP